MEDASLFGPLQRQTAFRSDLLHFIRLAGNYAAQIFIDCRNRASSKQRQQFALWLDNYKAEIKDNHLRDELITRASWFDAHKSDFTAMLEAMPYGTGTAISMRDRLAAALTKDHLLPLDYKAFIRCLDDLREYRHWLEHYEERTAKGEGQPVTDKRLLQILGLFLLPFLGNHLVGRAHHHGRKIGWRNTSQCCEQIRQILQSAIAERREASRFLNGLKLRSDHETIRNRIVRKYGNEPSDKAVHRMAKEDAKKRRDLESRKAALLELHRKYFTPDHWPRYNFENFLIRFAFIGRGRIAELEELLTARRQDAPAPDFILGIEPAFMLSQEIALIFHSWLGELEAMGVPVRSKKKVGSVPPVLRNAIAHGGWFWGIENPDGSGTKLSLSDLLAAVLDLPDQFNLPASADIRNRLLTALEAELRPCLWARVYRKPATADEPNQRPPPIVVKSWTAERRAQFADRTVWQVERRPALRSLAARWMRDIQQTRLDKF